MPYLRELTPHKISLRWVLVGAVQIGVAVGLAGYSYYNSQRAIKNIAHDRMEEASDRVGEHLKTSTELPQAIAQVVADDLELSQIDLQSSNLQPLDAYFLKRVRTFNSVSFIGAGSKTGNLIGAGSVSQNGHSAYVVGVADNTTDGSFISYAVGAQGERSRQTNASSDPRSPEYQAALGQGKATWSTIQPSLATSSHDLAITAFKPFRAEGMTGMASVELHLKDLSDFLTQLSISPSAQVFILEPNGLLVASSDDRLYHVQNGQVQRRSAIASDSPLIRAAAKHWAEHSSQSDLRQRFEFDLAGQRHFVQVMPWQDAYGLRWMVVAVVPQSDFMQPIDHNAHMTLLLCGALPVALGAGVWLARLNRPLLRLNRTDDRLLADPHSDEVERAQPINTMAAQLKTVLTAYQESEQRFASLLESLPIGVSAVDPKGTVIYLNRAGTKLLGKDATTDASLESRTVLQTYYVAGTNRLYPANQLPSVRALRGEPAALVDDVEIHYETGEVVPLEVRSLPVMDDTGNILYAINVFQDISNRRQAEKILSNYSWTLATQVADRTAELAQANVTLKQEIAERRQTEQALRESEENFRAIFNQTFQLVGLLKPDGILLEANQTALDFAGIMRSEVVGKFFWETRWWSLSSATQNQLKQAVAQAATGEFVRYEVEVRGQDDRIATLNFSLRPIHDEMGQVRLLLSEGQDITEAKRVEAERKQAADALEAHRVFLYKVIDAVPSGIFVKDPEGRIVAINRAGAAIHGVAIEEALGKPVSEFGNITPAQFEEFQAINQAVMSTLQPQVISAQRIHNLQGEPRWYQTTINPFIDNQGQIQGIIGTSTDITDLKRAEEELRQAKNAAEAANQAKSIFLASMSHELRTPLNAILGFSQLMAKEALTPPQQKQLETINRNGEHLLQLINDVLSITKIESGHTPLEEATCKLQPLLESIEGMFSLRASSKNIQLRCDVAPEVPQLVYIDSRKLCQVLTNLIDNAIKFTTQGQVVIRVRLIKQLRTQDLLHFEVEDTGMGIAPHEQNLIFEAFVQSETGRRSQQGTGLGLPICRRFVQMMGGQLRVSSQPNQGSLFQFALPLRVDPQASPLPQIQRHASLSFSQQLSSQPQIPSALTTQRRVTLRPLDFQFLPTDWVVKLNHAARSADTKTIFRLLEEVSDQTELKTAIAALVHNFQLEEIIQLTETH